MLFNSMQYAVFFPAVTIIYFILPKKVRYIWLLISSYYFYMSWEPKYGALILFTTVITYVCGLLIQYFSNTENKKYDGLENDEKAISEGVNPVKKLNYRKAVLVSSIVINIALLIYFKYFDFLITNINGVLRRFSASKQFDLMNILLPVGISFFTFQAIGYTVDVYRKEIAPEKNFLRYALFVSFFPQLVAGPIERAGNLLHQLREPNRLTGERLREGLFLILVGVWQKVLIADNISAVIDPVFNDHTLFSGVDIVIAAFLFSIQIYCDFSGYTSIAIGSAKVIGIDLMNNFSAPFLSLSVGEFWRRWHISLSSWLRDYIYIPLGGNRKGAVRKRINNIIVFFISGLWHGAAWNYVFWGGLHGFFLVIEDILKSKKILKETDGALLKLIRRIFVFCLVVFAFTIFRAPSLSVAFAMMKHAAVHPGVIGFIRGGIAGTLFGSLKNLMVIFFAVLMLLSLDVVQYRTGDYVRFFYSQKEILRWVIYIVLILMVVIYGAYGEGYEQAKFIYFQF